LSQCFVSVGPRYMVPDDAANNSPHVTQCDMFSSASEPRRNFSSVLKGLRFGRVGG
jgi:hypothetical protein